MTRNHRKYKTTSSKEDCNCSKTKHKAYAKEMKKLRKLLKQKKNIRRANYTCSYKYF